LDCEVDWSSSEPPSVVMGLMGQQEHSPGNAGDKKESYRLFGATRDSLGSLSDAVRLERLPGLNLYEDERVFRSVRSI
jgi:hypothetical protein